jgi:hypothetical protein
MCSGEGFALPLCKWDNALKLLRGIDAIAELPAPIVPLLIRYFGIYWGSF